MGAFTSQGTSLPGSDLELRYTYDYADRRIRRSMDTDGAAGASAESVSFAAYAGDARTLEIARTDTFPGGFLGQVIQRNFYGNGADEILAVDKITWNGTTPTTSTFWTFTDHQDTVRDIVSGNATDRGQVVEHRQYDSFGKIVTQTTWAATTPGIDFGYAGRPLESRTGLSDNRARWYEPATGRFITEDPSGFKGGDANFYRYVGNDPLDKVDPSGLAGMWANYGGKQIASAVGRAGYGNAMQLVGGGTRPSVTPLALGSAGVNSSPSLSTSSLLVSTSTGGVYSPGQSAYSGLYASGEPTFVQGFATSLARNATGITVGAAAGVGIALAVPAAVLASPIVVGIGVGAAVAGTAYAGYHTGLSAYQAWNRTEVDWTGRETGRTLTRAEQGGKAGDAFVGLATITAGAYKAAAGRLGGWVAKWNNSVAQAAENVSPHSSANALRLRTQLAFEEAGILRRGGAGLTNEAIKTATEVPISGGRLTNPAVVQELTCNGSSITDWGKFTTRTIELPGGQRSPIHFYMNRVTKETNLNIDFKVKNTIK